MNPYFSHRYENGLQLLVEPVSGVRSAAYTLLVPGGVVHDPCDAGGTANLLTGLVTRGAGNRDSKQFTTALDNLGVQRSESTEIFHTVFAGATLSQNLLPGLEIVTDILHRPHLEASQLEFCKATVLQELSAIEDDPAQKLGVQLLDCALPSPLGRPVLGDTEKVSAANVDTLRTFFEARYRPNEAILGVAGAVDFEPVRDRIGELLGDWQSRELSQPQVRSYQSCRKHIHSDKLRTHLGIAMQSISMNDEDYFEAHGAAGVLSGGMSARLFTEVREKRGLCYSVWAQYMPLKDLGMIFCYSGTTSEQAAETLEVILKELVRLTEGISDDEVHRMQAGLKSSLVMQKESTLARAATLARSWYHLGRVRTIEEILRKIDALTPQSILGYLERHPLQDFTIVTLGPQKVSSKQQV